MSAMATLTVVISCLFCVLLIVPNATSQAGPLHCVISRVYCRVMYQSTPDVCDRALAQCPVELGPDPEVHPSCQENRFHLDLSYDDATRAKTTQDIRNTFPGAPEEAIQRVALFARGFLAADWAADTETGHSLQDYHQTTYALTMVVARYACMIPEISAAAPAVCANALDALSRMMEYVNARNEIERLRAFAQPVYYYNKRDDRWA